MKKKVNIILIIAVLSLWGSVAYRTICTYFIKDKSESVFLENYNAKQFNIIKKDTFELLSLSRDPFLNNTIEEKRIKPQKNNFIVPATKKVTSVKKENVKVPFPLIYYYGFIKSEHKKDEMVILKINNQIKRLRRNETFMELKIAEIYKDSIKLSNGYQIKTFFKS